MGVVGGSIGGLTAAVLLHEMGCDVQVFERSTAALQGRGAGIVVLPMTERYFTESGTGLRSSEDMGRQVALSLTYWSYIDRSGAIIDAAATNNRFTSWNTLYRALLERLPPQRYHLGHSAARVAQSGESAAVRFADGRTESFDLVVGADGIGSTVRETVAPGTPTTYAGYVAWRGTVLERDLPPESAEVFADAMVYQVLDRSHVLVYAIPGPDDSAEAGQRALNFVWYRNARGSDHDELMTDRHGGHRPATMPPGLVQERFVRELHADASAQLAPQLAELVRACEQPFIQAIFDMTADRFRRGRAILIGDAAARAATPCRRGHGQGLRRRVGVAGLPGRCRRPRRSAGGLGGPAAGAGAARLGQVPSHGRGGSDHRHDGAGRPRLAIRPLRPRKLRRARTEKPSGPR